MAPRRVRRGVDRGIGGVLSGRGRCDRPRRRARSPGARAERLAPQLGPRNRVAAACVGLLAAREPRNNAVAPPRRALLRGLSPDPRRRRARAGKDRGGGPLPRSSNTCCFLPLSSAGRSSATANSSVRSTSRGSTSTPPSGARAESSSASSRRCSSSARCRRPPSAALPIRRQASAQPGWRSCAIRSTSISISPPTAISRSALRGCSVIGSRRTSAGPICSGDIGEFWRRWHITLSFWLRDYVYLPLSVKLAEYPRLRRRPLLVGFGERSVRRWWSAASGTGIRPRSRSGAFGHGVLLAGHQVYRQHVFARLPAKRRKALATNPVYRAAATALTFFCMTLLWVFFRFPLREAQHFLNRLLRIS